MYLMIALSVISIAIMVEKGPFFFAVRANLERLAKALSQRLNLNDVVGARRIMESSRSAEAAIVAAGLLRDIAVRDAAVTGFRCRSKSLHNDQAIYSRARSQWNSCSNCHSQQRSVFSLMVTNSRTSAAAT